MPYKCIECPGGLETICGEDPHCPQFLKAPYNPKQEPEREKEVPPPFKRICIEFHKEKCPTITFDRWPVGEC